MKNWTVKSKLLLIGLLPATVIVISLLSIFAIAQFKDLEKSLEERGKALAKHLASASEFGVVSGNKQFISGLAANTLSEPDAVMIMIYDADKNIVVHATKPDIAPPHVTHFNVLPFVDNTVENFLSISVPIFETRIVMNSQSAHVMDDMMTDMLSDALMDTTTQKYETTNHIVGWTNIALSKESTSIRQHQVILQSTLVALFILLLTSIFARRLSMTISTPLSLLTAAVQQLERGDLNTRVNTGAAGEIKLLENGFNQMARSLQQSQDGLREKVEKATLNLKTALSQLQKKNDELEDARYHAEEANTAKSQFLANMSHELRTPLNAIMGYTDMLKEDAAELQLTQFSSDLEKIGAAGKHLLTLINDVLDLSKIEAGKMDLYLEEIDINGLITEIVMTIQPLLDKEGNSLNVSGLENIGSMHSDVTKIRQTLFNLLSNASKFTKQGQVAISAETSSVDGIEMIQFRVRDSGIGMTPAQVTKLFSPFTQADSSTTRKYGGTGLGLTISKHFCEMLGGTITVESEEGVGSTFIVSLPRETKEPNKESIPVASLQEIEQTRLQSVPLVDDNVDTKRRNKVSTILIIDDDASVRELLARFLRKEGFNVEQATSGADGIEKAQSIKPDVITLDVMMPGTDGWSVLRTLKEGRTTHQIPVIMLSIVADKNLGYALGASEYLTKPIDWVALSKAVKKCVRSKPNDKKLLVVEDDSHLRDLTRLMLEENGWAVETAENGQVALDKLAKFIPTLIVLDLMMPVMDGLEFLQHLRASSKWKNIPVIVVTSAQLTAQEQIDLSSMAGNIVQKGGFDSQSLLAEINQLVKQNVSTSK